MITAAEAVSIFVPPKLRSRCRDPRLVCNLGTYNLSIALPIDMVREKAGDKLSVIYDHAFGDMSVYVEQTPEYTAPHYGDSYCFSTIRLNCDIRDLKPVSPAMQFYLHHEDGFESKDCHHIIRTLGREFYKSEYRDNIMQQVCGSTELEGCFGKHSFGFLVDDGGLVSPEQRLREQKRRTMLMHVGLHPRFFDRFSHQFRYEIIFEEIYDTNTKRDWRISLSDGKPKAVFARQFPEDFGFKIKRENLEFFGGFVDGILDRFWRKDVL